MGKFSIHKSRLLLIGMTNTIQRQRLNAKQAGMGAWSAVKNDVNQWIQVDFKNKAIVTNILTQGTNSTTFYQWVKSYTVYYSNGRIDVAPYKKGGEVKVI